MSSLFLGIDTSCYTTSAACVDKDGIVSDKRTVLSVDRGERGLRQSDGVFQHIRNLNSLFPELLSGIDRGHIAAVGVSSRPRPARDSYMPVFLAGRACAASVAAALDVPLMEFSHQEGHIRAALLGNEALMEIPAMLSMHISGGTTEILRVSGKLDIELVGGTDDLHAGQFVDRVGVAMGLGFPCGKELEKLACAFDGEGEIKLPSHVSGCDCSFSGVETAAQRLIAKGDMGRNELAYAVYDCMARTFCTMLTNAADMTGCDTALIAGGVASSALLRRLMRERMSKRGHVELFFGESTLSSDNAVGTALLARDVYGARA